MTSNAHDEARRAGITVRRLQPPAPVERRRFVVSGETTLTPGARFVVTLEAIDKSEAMSIARTIINGATTVAAFEATEEQDDLPPIESIVDGRLQPESESHARIEIEVPEHERLDRPNADGQR